MKKIFIFILSLMLVFTPGYVNAEEPEPSGSPSTTEEQNTENTNTEETNNETSTENQTNNNQEETNNETNTENQTQENTEQNTQTQSTTTNETKTETKKVDYVLKSLTIKGGTLDKKFNSNTFKYTLTITDSKNFSIDADYDKDNIKAFTNDISKIDAINEVKVIVADKAGNVKNTYVLTIAKTEKNTKLAALKMPGYEFNEAFNSNTTSYTVTIPYEVETVSFEATAEDSNAKVNIPTSSLSNLKVGGNKIVITVTNGKDKTTYTIYVTRSEKSEVKEKSTSILKSALTTGNNTSSMTPPNPDSLANYIIITLGCLILASIGGIGIYFFIKTSPKRMKKEIIKSKKEVETSPIVEVNNENNQAKENNKIEELDD